MGNVDQAIPRPREDHEGEQDQDDNQEDPL
jgi:hypothetical protein